MKRFIFLSVVLLIAVQSVSCLAKPQAEGGGTTEYTPDDGFVFRGLSLNGEIGDLSVSDDVPLEMTFGFSPNPCEYNMSLILETQFATDSPETLDFSIEYQASTFGLGQMFQAWDWNTNFWIDFDGGYCGPFNAAIPFLNEGVYTFDLTQFIPGIVEEGTGRVRFRTVANRTGFLLNWPPTISYDRIWWTTTE